MSKDQAAELFKEASETGEISEMLVFITDNLMCETASEGLQHICTSLFSEAVEVYAKSFRSLPIRGLNCTEPIAPTTTECRQQIDAREVMTHLLAVDIALNTTLATLPYLIHVWRRTYSQLVLDTVRRRRACGAPISTSAVVTAMQAWTNELTAKVGEEVLPTIIMNDAYVDDTPAGPPSSCNAIGPSFTNNREEEKRVVGTLLAVVDLYDTLLIEDTASWATTVLSVLGAGWSRSPCSLATSDSEYVHMRENLLSRCIAGLTARGVGPILGAYDEQLEECDAHLSDFLYEDSERGHGERNEKMLALLQARETELDEVTLFKCHSESTESSSPVSGACAALGGLCVVAHSLAKCKTPLLFFSQPSSVFMSCVPLLSHCVKSTSVAGLLFSLSFLHCTASNVPKYSLDFAGEEASPFLWSANVSTSTSPSSLSFKTRRYEKLFNLLKQLIIVSSTCQNSDCREQAKLSILNILALFDQEGRVRLQSSLITLCPYPSVVTFLLNDLFRTWREYNSAESHSRPLKVMEEDFPTSVYNAMLSFHRNILMGQAEFVDPLVATVNFFYIFLSLDVKQQSWQRLSYDKEKLKWPPAREKRESVWFLTFKRLKEDLLPQLERLVEDAGHNTLEVLRPIDAFALSSCLSMLKAFL